MSAALFFNIPTISSCLPGTTVSFTVNPYIALAFCGLAGAGATMTAPMYFMNLRRSLLYILWPRSEILSLNLKAWLAFQIPEEMSCATRITVADACSVCR
jgi:hypothetical protein